MCADAEAADRGCGTECGSGAVACFEDAKTVPAKDACYEDLSGCLTACVSGPTTTIVDPETTTTTLPICPATCQCEPSDD